MRKSIVGRLRPLTYRSPPIPAGQPCSLRVNLVFPSQPVPSARHVDAVEYTNLPRLCKRPNTTLRMCQNSDRVAQTCSHKPVLVAEAALHTRSDGGGVAPPRGGGSGGRGAAADLYGPGNRFRLSVREPARMTAELRAREREQEERVRLMTARERGVDGRYTLPSCFRVGCDER